MENTQTQLGIGLHYGIPAKAYHADPCPIPSLSSGIARTLLAKSPAHAYMDHSRLGAVKREATEAMNTGSLVHAILSGSQDEIAVGNFDNYKTKAAQTWRDEAAESGRLPVLLHAYEEALMVAQSVRNRCQLGVTSGPFGPIENAPSEVTAIWQEGDAFCRARYDALVTDDFTADIWDWKSTKDISDRGIEKAIASYRYDIQQAFYVRGMESLFPNKRVSFIFVFFEVTAPYTVRRVCLSAEYIAQARKEVARAIDIWKACQSANEYPVTPPDTLTVEIPHYLSENDGEINIE